jgi:hypothetical protein
VYRKRIKPIFCGVHGKAAKCREARMVVFLIKGKFNKKQEKPLVIQHRQNTCAPNQTDKNFTDHLSYISVGEWKSTGNNGASAHQS